MKKSIIVIILFFFASTSFAANPPLTSIPVSNLGQTVKNLGSSNNVLLPTTMALQSNNSYQAVANLLTIPLYMYNPALGVAATAVIGFAFQDSKLDAREAYRRELIQANSDLLGVANTTFPATQGGINPSATWVWGGQWVCGYVPGTGIQPDAANDPPTSWADTSFGYSNAAAQAPAGKCMPSNGMSHFVNTHIYTSNPTLPGTPGLPAPQDITQEQANQLATALATAASTNSAVKNALDNLAKNYPDQLVSPQPQQITRDDFQKYINNTQNTSNQTLQTALNNTNITNQQIAGAQQTNNINQTITNQQQRDLDTYVAQPGITNPQPSTLNFQPLTDLKNTMMGKFPFVLVSYLSDLMTPLVASPVTPHFDVDLGIVQKTISLSAFDGFASIIRSIMAFLLYILSVLFCIRLFARM